MKSRERLKRGRKCVSLFAGIGGFDYAMERAGCEVVAQVEKEPFCLAVLETHWPKAERFTDVKEFGASRLGFPAKTFPSPESEQVSQGNALDCFMNLRAYCASLDPLGLSSRMYPDFSVQTTDETLQKSSAFSWSSAGMGFRGVCSTASISESPRDAVECSLSDVLESRVPPRFFLSARAAAGILRRAAKRGRTLPSRLQHALEALARTPADLGTHGTQPTQSAMSVADAATEPSSKTNRTLFTPQKDQANNKSLQGRSEVAAGAEDSNQTPSRPQTVTSYWDGTQRTESFLLQANQAKDSGTKELGLLEQRERIAQADQVRLLPILFGNQTAITGEAARAETDATTSSRTHSAPTATTNPTPQDEEERMTSISSLSRKTSAEKSELAESAHSSPVEAEKQGKDTPLLSVRRLTPTECEILQGFPKGWTVPDTEHWATPLRRKSSSGSCGE